MENNLLDKFKFGDKLRELLIIRQGVYSYLPAEKAKYLEDIATIQLLPFHLVPKKPMLNALHKGQSVFLPGRNTYPVETFCWLV